MQEQQKDSVAKGPGDADKQDEKSEANHECSDIFATAQRERRLLFDKFSARDEDLFSKCQSWTSLKDVQKSGVQFLAETCFKGDLVQGSILAHDMGVGKTAQAITFLDGLFISLQQQNIPLKALILCPAVLLDHWTVEFDKWAPNISLINLHGISRQDAKLGVYLWCTRGGTMLLSFQQFVSFFGAENGKSVAAKGEEGEEEQAEEEGAESLEPFFTAIGPDVLICDEAQALCNPNTMLAKTICKLTTPVRIALTASPLQNNLMDLYSLVKFASPNLLGNEEWFLKNFAQCITAGSYEESSEQDIGEMHGRQFLLNCLVQEVMQRVDSSLLDSQLPAKTDYNVFVDVSDTSMVEYNSYLEQIDAGSCKRHFLATFSNLKKIIFDSKLLKDHKTANAAAPNDGQQQQQSTKIKLVLAILDECLAIGDKVVIFSHYVEFLGVLDEILKQKYAQDTRGMFIGNMKSDAKKKILQRFNDPKSRMRILLMSTKAGGVGLILTGANRAILIDASWNPTVDEQAARRIYRWGQSKRTFVYRIVCCNTIEQRILKLQQSKDNLFLQAIEEKKIVSQLSLQSCKMLLLPIEKCRHEELQVANHHAADEFLDKIVVNKDNNGLVVHYSSHNGDIVLSQTSLPDEEKARWIEKFMQETP